MFAVVLVFFSLVLLHFLFLVALGAVSALLHRVMQPLSCCPLLVMRAWPSCRRFLVLLLLVFLFLFLFRLLGLLHRHLLLLLLGLLHLFGLLLDLLQTRLRLGFILGSLRCRLLCDLSD